MKMQTIPKALGLMLAAAVFLWKAQRLRTATLLTLAREYRDIAHRGPHLRYHDSMILKEIEGDCYGIRNLGRGITGPASRYDHFEARVSFATILLMLKVAGLFTVPELLTHMRDGTIWPDYAISTAAAPESFSR